MRMLLADLKTYALEVYGPDGADDLLWSHDSDQPFSPMGCGDLLIIPEAPGAQLIVRVTAQAIFPNCPRYIPTMTLSEPSAYTPRAGEAPLEPSWKASERFSDVVPQRRGET